MLTLQKWLGINKKLLFTICLLYVNRLSQFGVKVILNFNESEEILKLIKMFK